jgi:UDP-N-acetylmuramyl pentapeptide synthase
VIWPGSAREEGWVGEVLPANGKLFIHAEGEWVTEITRRMAARVITLGLTPGNDWRARDLLPDKEGVSFTVEGPSAAFQGEYPSEPFWAASGRECVDGNRAWR